MGAIQQLQTAGQINGRMVRQAMQEAQADPTQMKALQAVVDQRAGCFDDVRTFDMLVGFVQQYYQDRFELRPNTDNPPAKQALVDEARITKERNTEQIVQLQPPPPPPNVGRYRDPLNISGSAEAGARVEFYNASQPGRPVIGEQLADATGRFRFELTDESKFQYGDQIGVVVFDASGKPSKPVVVPTEPFEIHNNKLIFRRGTQTVNETMQTTVRALDPKKDDRDPFLQRDSVSLKFTPPATADALPVLEIVGKDDAVEPNSTLTVRVGGEEFTTKADPLGKFALKVQGFEPGQLLKLEVKDVNGRGIDTSYNAPEIALSIASLAGGVERPPSPRQPADARETVGQGPPWVHFKAADVTVPHGAVMMRNLTTGDVYELTADEKGRINAAVGGIDNHDVLEVVARDARGNISKDAELFVMLPEKIARDAGFFVPASALTQKQPDVTRVVEAIKGPPEDLLLDGKPDPRGPFLRMPDITGMPPFGQLAVVREDEVIQYLRADKDGRLQGMLRGVHVGDQLNFQVLDAAGRKFPVELAGWTVPDAGKTSKVPEQHVHSEDRPLADAIGRLGEGKLDLHREWLTPFTIKTGAVAVPETNVPLHYRRQFFDDGTQPKSAESSFDFFPPALLDKMKISAAAAPGAQLTLSRNEGTTRIDVGFHNFGTQTVGVDYVMGRVNLGSPNAHIQVPGHLPNLTQGLRSCLAFVALAYEQGKEPGDVEYDRAMGAAKTFLYVFDRLAVQHPDQKDAIVAAANAALPDGGFPFELISRFKVPPSDKRPSEGMARARSGAMSVLEARSASLGGISGVGQVGRGDGSLKPPRVESAAVLFTPAQHNAKNYTAQVPLRVAGSASPGDIVQIYNVSSGARTLLGDAVAGVDGKFRFMGGGDIRAGDQLGLVTLTSDGKKSAMAVVPTDTYAMRTHDIRAAQPMSLDDRPPYFRIGATKIDNASFDSAGKARAGGPFWKLSGGELAVEPFSKVTITSKTPDGQSHVTTADVDGEGKFSVEFPHAARSSFAIQVTDRNGAGHILRMATAALNVKSQSGDDAKDAALGAVTFKMPDGKDVRGIVVATDINGGRDDTKIPEQERSDAFVDVVVRQQFGWTASNGEQQNHTVTMRIKIAKDDATAFDAHPNHELPLLMPGFETMPVPGTKDGTEMAPIGNATVVTRDYGSL